MTAPGALWLAENFHMTVTGRARPVVGGLSGMGLWAVPTSRGGMAVKAYPDDESRTVWWQRAYTIEASAHRHGVPCPAPREPRHPSHPGGPWARHQASGLLIRASEWVDAEAAAQRTTAQAALIGAALAELHNVPTPPQLSWLGPPRSVEAPTQVPDLVADRVARVGAYASELAEEAARTTQHTVCCHRDPNPHNALIHQDGDRAALVDFDSADLDRGDGDAMAAVLLYDRFQDPHAAMALLEAWAQKAPDHQVSQLGYGSLNAYVAVCWSLARMLLNTYAPNDPQRRRSTRWWYELGEVLTAIETVQANADHWIRQITAGT